MPKVIEQLHPAWHLNGIEGRKDRVRAYIDWAIETNQIKNLLCLEVGGIGNSKKAIFHCIAKSKGSAEIFKALLELADKYEPGLAKELLMMNDECNKNVLDYARRPTNQYYQRNNATEILEIIESYLPQVHL